MPLCIVIDISRHGDFNFKGVFLLYRRLVSSNKQSWLFFFLLIKKLYLFRERSSRNSDSFFRLSLHKYTEEILV